MQLAAAIGFQGRSRRTTPRRPGTKQIHPATRVFQVCIVLILQKVSIQGVKDREATCHDCCLNCLATRLAHQAWDALAGIAHRCE